MADNKSVPTFNSSDTKSSRNNKLEVINIKTLKHIEEKTDSIFIRRLRLKENDSIRFNISYLVTSSGITPMDSVKINTGVTTLDNYMKLMIYSLPKFVPALNPETKKAMDFRINMEAKFTVQNKKLKAIHHEEPELKTFSAILEGCHKEKTDLQKKKCSSSKINDYLLNELSHKKLPISKGVNELRILLKLSIGESGKIEDVTILRTSITDEKFCNELKGIFKNSPLNFIVENPNQHTKGNLLLPLTFKIDENKSYLVNPDHSINRYNTNPHNGYFRNRSRL